MSRSQRDNQRRLDRIVQREVNGHERPLSDWPWRRIPRRGNNRNVARVWERKWRKAERYKGEPQQFGKFRII